MTAWTDAIAALATAPTCWYKLDETSGTTANDSSGNANHGTYDGTFTLNQGGLVTGDPGNASVSLTGTTNATRVSAAGSTSSRTFSTVFTVDSTDSTGGIVRSGGTGTNRTQVAYSGSDVVVEWGGTDSTLTWTGGATTLSDGNPHLVILRCDLNLQTLWVDGSIVASNTLATSTGSTTGGWQLGTAVSGNTVGLYDEWLLFNSYISDGDVADLWDAWQGGSTSISLAGDWLDWAGELNISVLIDGTLAGDWPDWTGSFDVEVEVDGVEVNLEGSWPAWTGSFGVSVPELLTIAGEWPDWTGSLNVDIGSISGDVAGSWRAWTGEINLAPTPQTNIHNRTSGRHRRSYATATWSPPVAEPLESVEDYLTAVAFSEPEFETGRPIYTTTEAMTLKHRHRIVVGGKDVTFFRDTPTPTPTYHLIQPLLYGSGTLELPQIHPAFERIGHGALFWLRPDAVVKVQVVDVETNQVVREDFRGIITKFSARGKGLSCVIGGEITGRAGDDWKPPPQVKVRKDGGDMLADLIRGPALRPLRPRRGPVTGITLSTIGSMGLLEAINQTVTMLTKVDGTQRTVTLDEEDGVWIFPTKDLETIHATAYISDGALTPDLTRDTSEEPNVIFVTAVDREGRKIKFAVYPGLVQGPIPDYPNDGGATISQGDTDEDTDSGDGVSVMIQRLMTMGYTDRQDSSDLVFDGKVTQAIKDLQDAAGETETGVMNVATWRALWDLSKTGYSLRDIQIVPAAQRSYTKPWLRSASGALTQKNPNFNPHRRRVARSVDLGVVDDRQQAKEYARSLLTFGESNWVGTLECHIGLIRGEHNYGDPLTAVDVMDPREMRPGMNLWSPNFDGGTLFHVVGCGVGDTVQLILDTKARDTLPAWEAIKRNRATRHSSARAWLDQYRSSITAKDAIVPWDPIGGTVDHRVSCPGGRWTVFPIVAGQAGTVQRIEMELINNHPEFCMAVFGRSIRPERLDHLVPNPLDEDGDDRWSDNDVLEQLQERVFLYSSGTHEQPLGYFPKAKTGEDGEPTGHAITGRHKDDASFSYHTFAEPVLYVAIWPDRDCSVKPGRIMWNQLEEGS